MFFILRCFLFIPYVEAFPRLKGENSPFVFSLWAPRSDWNVSHPFLFVPLWVVLLLGKKQAGTSNGYWSNHKRTLPGASTAGADIKKQRSPFETASRLLTGWLDAKLWRHEGNTVTEYDVAKLDGCVE